MRIISGQFKGLQLKVPTNLPVRPTTDFAKTGLFNILNNRFHFATCDVLDLYAGTGNLSFEFISRGVNSSISIDKDPGCVRFIKSAKQQIASNAPLQVIQSDVIRYLCTSLGKFDIIVADPPYAITPGEELVQLIFERKMLKPGGVFILEHSKERDFSNQPNFQECRKYGQVAFSFFQIEENN